MQTCLICDDHPLVASGLAAMVGSRWPDADVTLSGDFPAAWAAAAARPDLCLVDLEMPGAAPLPGVAGLLAVMPASRLIVVTGSHDDAQMLALLAEGIAGFVPKTAPPAVMLAAIELVLAGGRFLPPRLAALRAHEGAGDHASLPEPARAGLTARQAEVAALLADGLSNKDIARRLAVSPATVKSHVAAVIAVLGAGNRTDAAVKTRSLGIA